jgi:hypothetical protein
MNKKQKNTIIVGIILIVVVLLFWISQGGEIFTKTQIIIDKTSDLDKMLGIQNKEFIDKFVFGLLPSGFGLVVEFLSASTLGFTIIVISGFLIYLFKNKKKEKQ